MGEVTMEGTYLLGPGQLFTVFFIILGPFQIIPSFARVTEDMPQAQVNSLAVKSTLVVIPILIGLGLLGRILLENWMIPRAVLELITGLIFAFVAFSILLLGNRQFGANSEFDLAKGAAITPLGVALKMVVSTQGLATLIVLLTVSHDSARTLLIFGVLIAVLLLNLLAMIFRRFFLGQVGATSLQVVGIVLGVMQAGLALAIIHLSLMELHKDIFS
ncbi:MarC family protein [Bdellovibrio bacteriovorus]